MWNGPGVQVGAKVFVPETGTWGSLAGRTVVSCLREWQATVGAALATDAAWVQACAERGLTVGPDGGIVEVPEEVEAVFSTRHVAIAARTRELVEEFTAAQGRRPSARELVWIDQKAWDLTRPKKGERPLLDAQDIRARLEAMGAGALLTHLTPSGLLRDTGVVPVFDLQAAIAAGLAAAVQREVLREEDLRILAADGIAAVGGACADVRAAIEQVALRIRAQCAAVDLPGGLTGWVPLEVLAAARTVHGELAVMRTTAGVQAAGLRAVEVAGLTPGQQVAAEAVAAGLPVVIEGPAGTGKTTALRRALAARSSVGLRTVAVAPSAAAVHQLGEGWTAAVTVHALLVRGGWQMDAAGRWAPPRDTPGDAHGVDGDLVDAVLIVDEAGMLDLHTMAALTQHATGHGARVVLVGDDRQLAPVGVAGGFTLAAMTSDPIRLVQAQRFTDPNHADLVRDVRALGTRDSLEPGTEPSRGVDAVVARLLDAGIVRRYDSEVEAQVAVAEIAAADRDALVMVADNETAVAVNRLAHSERTAAGQVRDVRAGVGRFGEDIGVGDLVQTRRNDNLAGVHNRQRWIVEHLDTDGSMVVTRADRRSIRKTLTPEYVAAHVHRADAVTVHAAQGATAVSAHALVDETWTREQAYVALTRGKTANLLHVVADSDDDARDVLAGVLRSSDRDRAEALARIVLVRQAAVRTDLVPGIADRLTRALATVGSVLDRVTTWVPGGEPRRGGTGADRGDGRDTLQRGEQRVGRKDGPDLTLS